MNKEGRKVAVGAVIAAAAGYVAGILTAPKSGKETRKDLQNVAVKAKTEGEKKLKVLHSELGDLIEEGKKKSKDLASTAKGEFNEALAKAQRAKDKAREVLSALHEGDSEDQDLKKAINNSKKAIDNLKAYLKKN
jgi:gas vesicle protein